MKGRRLLALSALALVFGCEDNKTPTGPTGLSAPTDPSEIISDGAHNNGNPDFFFLPPMVPLPLRNANFELGKFNNTLKPSLKIEICQLKPANGQGLPKANTPCVDGGPLKTFAPGSVKLVNLPVREHGWWNLFGLPPDGFYYVLWDTRQSNLKVDKYYRIKVFIAGPPDVLLGIADVDPMANLFQWKFSLTGEVIQLIDDVLLPIPFRVERGGGPALCGGATLCTSATVGNRPPGSPDEIIRVVGADGSAIAGVRIPAVFLPPNGPQSVVLTITRVNTVENTGGSRTLAPPGCHPGLPLQQFNSCFHFSTIPELSPIPDGAPGHELDQFVSALTVAVCFVLHDTVDPREPWVQLWTSDEGGANARPLRSAPDAEILTGETGHTCGANLIGFNIQPNGFRGLASAGWAKLKGGVGALFGVKTAYAVDLGLGGLTFDFSNIGPALTAEIRAASDTEMTVLPGSTNTVRARLVGTQVHNGQPLGDVTIEGNTHGIPGLPVTLTLAPGNGTMIPFFSEGPPVTQAIVTSSDYEDSSLSGGFASVSWTVPTAPGTYTLTATGPARGGPVTFTAIVPASPPPINFIQLGPTERRMLSMQTGAGIQITVTPPNVIASWLSSSSALVSVSSNEFSLGFVNAVLGGDVSIEFDNDALLTSVLSTENPGPSVLVNSFSFDLFPRTTTLAWNAVVGAVSYQVVTEFGNASATDPFCAVPAACGVWTVQPTGSTTTPGLMHTFDFVGSQPGRWRVFARNASGAIINTSAYVYFDYDI